jgi:hypothetical protein
MWIPANGLVPNAVVRDAGPVGEQPVPLHPILDAIVRGEPVRLGARLGDAALVVTDQRLLVATLEREAEAR